MTRILFLLMFVCELAYSQSDSTDSITDIKKFQAELNREYRTKGESPLEPNDFSSFKEHDFFPIDLKYRVVGKLKRTNNSLFFQMKTTTSKMSTERVFGIVTFKIEGKEFSVPVYQSQSLMQTEAYKDYLFFPFTDLTNGDETYDGGRYIDLRIPSGEDILIDFNKAYNPYCAYSHRYSCPIVPPENRLDAKILAGTKYKKK
ncbi:MAG: DUF1684 domain-containing protein [Cyclobacteriaceae bacterium]